MSKLPAIQFYPGDWMKDPAVRSVSIDARGLWIDMLCLMHESARRGYLQHSTGEPVTEEQLARITGCTQKQVARLLGELTTTGVFSCTDTGVIYNRRMVRDEEIRVIRAESGSMGGRPKKQNESKTKANEKQNITPSSSSSSSSSKDLKSVCDTRATYPPYHSQSGQDLHQAALSILHELNERCNKHFPDSYNAGLGVIKDRLLENREPHEFARIIEVKLHDPLFQKKPNLYDPITLFAADKFDTYLNQDTDGWNSNKGKPTQKPKPEPVKPPIVRRTVNPDPELVAWFRRTVVDPMRDEVNEHAWKAFIEPLVPVSKNGDGLVLYADRNVRQWVEEHRLSQIAALAGCGVLIIDDEDE